MNKEQQLAKMAEVESTIDLLGKSNTRSLINIMPRHMGDRLEELSFTHPEYFTRDERELEKELKPSPTLRRIKISFWHEYHRAQEKNRPMYPAGIYGGICLPQFFHSAVMQKDLAFAWLLSPPTDYMVAMEEALVHAIKRVREVLDMPIDGNPKVAALMLKAMELLDARLHGTAVQRIESKNVSVQVTTPATKPLPTPEELEAKIKQLEIETGMRIEHDTTAHDKQIIEVLSEQVSVPK